MKPITKALKIVGSTKISFLRLSIILLVIAVTELLGFSIIIPVLVKLFSNAEPTISFLSYRFSQNQIFIGLILFFIVRNLVFIRAIKHYNFKCMEIVEQLNLNIYRKVFSKSYVELNKYGTDVILNIFNHQLLVFTSYVILPLIRLFIDFVVFFVVVLFIYLKYPLFMFGLTGILLVFFLAYKKFYRSGLLLVSKNLKDSSTGLTKSIRNNVLGYKDILLYKKGEYFNANFSDALYKYTHNQTLYFNSQSIVKPTIESIVIVLFIGIIQFFKSNGVEEKIAFVGIMSFALLRIYPFIIQFIQFLQNLNYGNESIIDLYNFLIQDNTLKDEVPATEDMERFPIDYESKLKCIKVNGVSYGYENRVLFEKLNLEIPGNQIIGLVGKSGSGKSTLAYILAGLYKPHAGKVLFEFQNNSGRVIEISNPSVSLIPQDIFILDDTVLANVAFGEEEPNEEKVLHSLMKSKFSLGYEDEKGFLNYSCGENGMNLSGGQRQRLAIARALYFNSNILILDEATSGVDAETELAFFDYLQELKKTLTILVITHNSGLKQYFDLTIDLPLK